MSAAPENAQVEKEITNDEKEEIPQKLKINTYKNQTH
jgi:hypothetical protein